jgi:hypothetical protein
MDMSFSSPAAVICMNRALAHGGHISASQVAHAGAQTTDQLMDIEESEPGTCPSIPSGPASESSTSAAM